MTGAMTKDQVVIKIDRSEETVTNATLASAIRDANTLYRRRQDITGKFNKIRDDVLGRSAGKYMGNEKSVTMKVASVDGEIIFCRVTKTCGYSVPEKNVGKLKKLLGNAWKLLVKEKTTRTPSATLIKESEPEVLRLLDVTEKPNIFTLGAEKK